MLSDTSADVQLFSHLVDGATYQWMVSVSDGHSTVASADTFSFTVHLVTGVADRRLRIPAEYALHQNYPNPFNPTTVIQLDLPLQSVVTLKVNNLLGQEVATLLDRQMLDEGDQEAEFNASSLASGVYFYRLIAEPVSVDDQGDASGAQTFVSMKKMILLK